MDENGPELEGDDALAAEYVLGVLPADEWQSTSSRIEADAAFARRVDEWEVRMSPIAAAYPETEPPASVKSALDARLFASSRATTAAEAAQSSPGLWQSLAFWRGLTVAALAALALYVAIPFISPPSEPTPTERLVASLADDDTDVRYYVVYDAANSDVGLSHVAGARGQDQDFELWVIEGDTPPQSLGVIPEGSAVHLAVAGDVGRKIAAGAVFAISMEPRGGSPTGQPTGPVVAAGDLKNI